jgi:hypothetical protein
MQFDVPFIPDPEYTAFLAALGGRIHAVHFSLFDPELSDARIRMRAVEARAIADQLQGLPGPKKYLLANGRFQPAGRYGRNGGTRGLIRRLTRLRAAGILDGIIFSDAYLLTALSDAAPDLAGRLEAVPSINFSLDSIRKIQSVLGLIARSRFRMPGKIVLDRDLNRNPEALFDLVGAVRRRYPETRPELLVNEGCLPQCPYRQTHEALIASTNAGNTVDHLGLNRDLGCMRVLNGSPHLILSSPFIRPEDLRHYKADVATFKICGRTLGRDFLMRAVSAFTGEKYTGNLFDLLDASHWMAEKWELPNEALPEDFFHRMTRCRGHCDGCPVCLDLFRRIARRRPFQIPDFGPAE